MLRSFLDVDSEAVQTANAIDIEKLRAVAEGIDWDTQINHFLSGDLSGLLSEEANTLDALAEHASIAPILARTSLPPKLLLLAWLAKQFVAHSRAAQRFAAKVLGQVSDRDVSQEILRQIPN